MKKYVLISFIILLFIGLLVAGFYLKTKLNPSENLSCINKISVDRFANTSETIMKAENIQNLEKVNVVKLTTKKSIGLYKGTLIDPYEIFKLLVQTRKIDTFLHLSSDLCVTKEMTVGDDYIAQVHAKHSYCTNKCITEDYNFEFGFNTKTQEVAVKSN